jgi:hypothetical protein
MYKMKSEKTKLAAGGMAQVKQAKPMARTRQDKPMAQVREVRSPVGSMGQMPPQMAKGGDVMKKDMAKGKSAKAVGKPSGVAIIIAPAKKLAKGGMAKKC